jgi:hypothetical protein
MAAQHPQVVGERKPDFVLLLVLEEDRRWRAQ